MVAASHPSSWRRQRERERAFVAVEHELSEQARIEDVMETAVNLRLLHSAPRLQSTFYMMHQRILGCIQMQTTFD
jgi:hypothetical protein